MGISNSIVKERLLGVDTGGTFTDFVLWDGHRLRVHKVLSTPAAPERAILRGLTELGLDNAPLRLRHGSTVATNALLEGKGVRTVYIANRGLADILTIGRQQREHLYQLSPQPQTPPVPAELCLEVDARTGADGTTVTALSEAELHRLVTRVRELAPTAVAINLLFSYQDATAERRIEAALKPYAFVARSSTILAESGEYERGIATWLNAYIGPLMANYLQRLSESAPQARVAVMQSSGLTISAKRASRHAVQLLLSGPAGGLAGARAMGKLAGFERLMTLDVGGTSTDVALIDGDIGLTREGRVGRYPVAVPMVDMHTVGAGGGSIARVDRYGMLLVGPESAGADPGPACYGNGGTMATVTDAHLLLGRIPISTGLGNAQALSRDAAAKAFAPLAAAMGQDITEAARAVLRLTNEHIAGALRLISIERGHDPQAFTLCCFGGAGGLHACEAADLLGMRQVLVPIHAGVLSALGMLYSPAGQEQTQALQVLLADCPQQRIERGFDRLQKRLLKALIAEGIDPQRCHTRRQADLRYSGQSFTLTLDWHDAATTGNDFHETHKRRYGHALDHPVELVNLRVRIQAPGPELSIPIHAPTNNDRLTDTDYLQRSRLAPDSAVSGPCVIADSVGTAWVAEGWQARLDPYGNLLLCKAE